MTRRCRREHGYAPGQECDSCPAPPPAAYPLPAPAGSPAPGAGGPTLPPERPGRAARLGDHAVPLVPHLAGHPYVDHGPGGHDGARHTADHHGERQPGPGQRAQERHHRLDQRHGYDQDRPHRRRAHRVGQRVPARGLLDPQRPVFLPPFTFGGLLGARRRRMSRSGAPRRRSACERTATLSSGAPRRSAVPITVSLPTASRPLAPASEDPDSPVAARLALFYAAGVRDTAPVAHSAPNSHREGRTRPREDSHPAKNSGQPPVRGAAAGPGAGAGSRWQSPLMPGQLGISGRRSGSSPSDMSSS